MYVYIYMIIDVCIYIYIRRCISPVIRALFHNHLIIAEDPWNIDAYLVHERAHVYSMELRDPQVACPDLRHPWIDWIGE